jgi:HNH endonuclease/AP2 domain
MLTQERLKELLSYDPETGEFIWFVSRQGGAGKAGMIAGLVGVNNCGYKLICIDYVMYLSHRLVWLYVHGRWPYHQIDHINGKRDDNRLINLREATQTQNNQNIRKPQSNNTSGYLGAYWDKRKGKWGATIQLNKKSTFLGYFNTVEEASRAYLTAKLKYHEFCPREEKQCETITKH